jgi:UDP-N-acetyl-2-amino-2-deoxyglucuronate dehydrogenase
MFKVITIGKGFIFDRHEQVIEDLGGKIIATCDNDSKKNADFFDYRELLQSPICRKTDIISILTPNYLHAEMIRDTLRTNKIILCEKPLTINTDFSGLDGVNIVQQLHYHPLFNEICAKLQKARKVKAVLRAYRDEDFWQCWKGDEQKSGGVVYILGAHIWDLLVSALGNDFRIIRVQDSMRSSNGVVEMNGVEIEYSFEFLCSREGQTRHLEIDGEKYILSLKDNLSFEGLHDKVYEELLKGNSRKLSDVIPSIRIMDAIKKVE